MAQESRIFMRAGYAMAFASLCSLAALPTGHALADEGVTSSPSTATYATSQSNAAVATEKNETVNVATNADGSVKTIEVSSTLKTGGNRDVADASILRNLKPDDENVWFSDQGELVWHTTDGADIAYKGETDAALPLELKVTYRYNGSYITPQELLGKTGHVVIRYDYINNSTVTVDGITVRTPFMAITGMLLDNDVFSNVKVTNGRLVEDGDRTIAIGYAMPGLSSSIDAGDDFEVPDYFEVEADVVDFELKSTLTMVSPDMLDGIDTSDFATGEYADASAGLTSAMAELTKGSSELADGLKQLADGAKQLADGAARLDEGANEAIDQMPDLTSGIAYLHAGSSQLASGAQNLQNGLVEFKEGLGQAQDKLASAASSIDVKALSSLGTALSAAGGELQADAGAIQGMAANAATASARIDETLVGIDEAVNAVNSSSLEDDEKAKLLAPLNAAKAAAEGAKSSASAAVGEAQNISTDKLQAAATALQGVDPSMFEGLGGLGTALQPLVENADKLIAGASGLASGASDLDAGLAQLESKSGELESGMSELASGVSELSTGSTQLSGAIEEAAKGSDAMTEGLQQFNDEGISKITDAIDNKLVKLGNRFAAVADAGGMYKNFSGITEGTAGSVKFIFETEAIEAD